MRAQGRDGGPTPSRIDFDRRKYGHDLLIDAACIREMPTFVTDGRPHVLGFHDILLVTQGRGHLLLDGERQDAAPGIVLFSLPGQVREWRITGRLDGACVFFAEAFVADTFSDAHFLDRFSYFRPGRPSGALHLAPAERREFMRCFAAMQHEIARRRKDASQSLRAGLYQALVLLDRWYVAQHGESGDAPSNRFVGRFLRLVDRDFARRHRVGDYAARLGVSPGHLNVLCRVHARRSAGASIRARLVAEARKLLLHSELTAAEIGQRLGFDDAAYFARFFRRETGVAPGEFRRLRGD